MKAVIVILEATGLSFLVGKLAEHITWPIWGMMPAFYRFAILAAMVGSLCVGIHELRKTTK